MTHKQLNFQKRCKIYAFWKAGYNQSQIAKEVGVHKSTISREFKRNITFVRTSLGSWQYKTHYAQTWVQVQNGARLPIRFPLNSMHYKSVFNTMIYNRNLSIKFNKNNSAI